MTENGEMRMDAGGLAERAFRAEPGSLYVVATPIGNLRDVTLRALDILRSADVICAEDTRVTAKLLARYGVTNRPRVLHAHNEAREVERVQHDLAAGRSVAIVSDAGTPAISDPGARVVRAVARAGAHVLGRGGNGGEDPSGIDRFAVERELRGEHPAVEGPREPGAGGEPAEQRLRTGEHRARVPEPGVDVDEGAGGRRGFGGEELDLADGEDRVEPVEGGEADRHQGRRRPEHR